MRIELDKRYMKRIKYFTLGFVIVYIIYAVIENLNIVVINMVGFLKETISILSPLIWGIIIAYLLFPLVKFFENNFYKINIKKAKSIERKKIIRMASITLTFGVVFLIFLTIGYSIFVMIGGSFKNFSWEETWNYIQEYIIKYSEEIRNIVTALEEAGISNDMLNYVDSFSKNFSEGIKTLLSIFASKIGTIGKYIIDISFGFVFAVNILYNREYFYKLFDNFLRLTLSDKRRKSILSLCKDINRVLSSFIRGKMLDLTILSFVTVVALIIIKFEFSLLIGIFAGYTNIIPYLGTWIGIIPAVIIALINESVQSAIIVGLYIVIVQQIYIMLVSPKIQGKSIGIHPFFVLLSLIVFGTFFGLLGMIFSIPFAGIIKVLIYRWAKHRQEVNKIELHKVNNF